MQSPYQFVKFVMVGESAAGKTSLLLRATHREFNEAYSSTVGVDFGATEIRVGGAPVRVQVWDTAGQERFRSVTAAFYRSADCCVVVYDVTRRETFDAVASWVDDLRHHGRVDSVLAIVGNKTDLPARRAVATEEGEALARHYDALFFETSARNGANADAVFHQTAAAVLAKRAEREPAPAEPETAKPRAVKCCSMQ